MPRLEWPRDVIACEALFARRMHAIEVHLMRAPGDVRAIVSDALINVDATRVPRNAGAAQVAQLVVHLLRRRSHGVGQPLTAPDAIRWCRRMRALLGGPVEPVKRLSELVSEAVASTGAPATRFECRLDDRDIPLPYVAAFLVLEELLANAVEHGDDAEPIVVEGARAGLLVGVTSRCFDAAGAADRVQGSSDSGTRFVRSVCEAWRLHMKATATDATHLRVAVLE
jgi:hypothetical protein